MSARTYFTMTPTSTATATTPTLSLTWITILILAAWIPIVTYPRFLNLVEPGEVGMVTRASFRQDVVIQPSHVGVHLEVFPLL